MAQTYQIAKVKKDADGTLTVSVLYADDVTAVSITKDYKFHPAPSPGDLDWMLKNEGKALLPAAAPPADPVAGAPVPIPAQLPAQKP